jgi:hypothetical protein
MPLATRWRQASGSTATLSANYVDENGAWSTPLSSAYGHIAWVRKLSTSAPPTPSGWTLVGTGVTATGVGLWLYRHRGDGTVNGITVTTGGASTVVKVSAYPTYLDDFVTAVFSGANSQTSRASGTINATEDDMFAEAFVALSSTAGGTGISFSNAYTALSGGTSGSSTAHAEKGNIDTGGAAATTATWTTSRNVAMGVALIKSVDPGVDVYADADSTVLLEAETAAAIDVHPDADSTVLLEAEVSPAVDFDTEPPVSVEPQGLVAPSVPVTAQIVLSVEPEGLTRPVRDVAAEIPVATDTQPWVAPSPGVYGEIPVTVAVEARNDSAGSVYVLIPVNVDIEHDASMGIDVGARVEVGAEPRAEITGVGLNVYADIGLGVLAMPAVAPTVQLGAELIVSIDLEAMWSTAYRDVNFSLGEPEPVTTIGFGNPEPVHALVLQEVTMEMHRTARQYIDLPLTTDTAGLTYEVSVDDGDTWVTVGDVVDTGDDKRLRIFLLGPDAETTDAPTPSWTAPGVQRVIPLARVIDTPEHIVANAGWIDIV